MCVCVCVSGDVCRIRSSPAGGLAGRGDYLRASAAELSWETHELPDTERLRLRIMRKVMEAGLNDFSPECVGLLQHAVEEHVKNIVGHHVQRIKPTRQVDGVRYTGLVAEAEASGGPAGVPAPLGTSPYRHVIRLRELVATLELAPHLLGENRSQLDRLVAGL